MKIDIGVILRKEFAHLNYEQIILFGSRARGDFYKQSDYDILIILKSTLSIKEKINLSTQIRRKLAACGIDADIIIKSKSEAAYYKNRIGNVVREALKEGVVL